MRKLLALAAASAVLLRFLSRCRRSSVTRVVVGYDDGSTVTLEPGSPERELLVDAANEAFRA